MYKVLIVEDEILVRLGLKNSIEWSKFDMTVVADVTNGQEAWEFYQTEQPDIIITDIRMPQMNGMELIHKIREKDKDTLIIILSCIEEFDMVRKALTYGVMDYILKLTMTEEEIEVILKNAQNKLISTGKNHKAHLANHTDMDIVKEKLLKDLLFYHVCSPKEFEAKMNELGHSIRKERLLLCILEIDDFAQLQSKLQDDKGLLIKLSMLNILNETLKNYKRGEAFYDSDVNYVLIFSFWDILNEQSLYQELYTILNSLKATIDSFFDISLSCGISSIQNDFSSLGRMYKEAKVALEQKFACGNGKIFVSGHRTELNTILEKLQTLKDIQGIENILPGDSLNKYHEEIQRFLNTKTSDRLEVQEFLIQLFNQVAAFINKNTDTVAAVISYSQQISRCDTLDGMIDLFKKSLAGVIGNTQREKVKSKEISEAMNYIKCNFGSDISLNKVAEHVRLSPAYLSNLFKKDLKINFTEYLNEVRIEKAKELLRDSYLKAYEISEKVGFSDMAYFGRVFKKLTGISPNEYRKNKNI